MMGTRHVGNPYNKDENLGVRGEDIVPLLLGTEGLLLIIIYSITYRLGKGLLYLDKSLVSSEYPKTCLYEKNW